MSVRAHLLRGVVAGLLAGLLVGLLSLLVAEPVIDRAVTLESQRVASEYRQALDGAIVEHHDDVAAAERQVPAPASEVYSRRTQRFGLVLADEPVRHTAVALSIVVALVLEFVLLPDNSDAVRVPADLLWDFRLRAVAAQLLLWGTLGGVFAVLTERAARRAQRVTTVRTPLSVAASRE